MYKRVAMAVLAAAGLAMAPAMANAAPATPIHTIRVGPLSQADCQAQVNDINNAHVPDDRADPCMFSQTPTPGWYYTEVFISGN